MNGAYWYSRVVFARMVAALFLIAFVCAANQFVPLLGQRGLLPVTRFVSVVAFRDSPSLFFLSPTDATFRAAAWLGIVLSCVAFSGVGERDALAAGVVWAAIWILYLSFVNVGQTFYAFGWESLLLETGFFLIFAGARRTEPSIVLNWVFRWVLFRLMFGAGLIKLRGDPCWRDLTCLDYFYETQPIPNPLSWYFHWLPHGILRAGVVFNHVAEVVVPFAYFAPQPVASIAGLVTIAFQLVLIAGGNLSWLNWAGIALAIPTLDDRWFSWLPIARPTLAQQTASRRTVMAVLAVLVSILSIAPVANMLSPDQMMNYSFNPIHLVNTYGAFGSITRSRGEIVIEGTSDAELNAQTMWREYQFKGKPGDPMRMPLQIAPYHLRLDWLMWFAAMSTPAEHPWFATLLTRLLEGDQAVLTLLGSNPFPDHPPKYVRAVYYEYRFTTPEEHRRTGGWWYRRLVGVYYPPVMLRP
jgi:hypothetical protein